MCSSVLVLFNTVQFKGTSNRHQQLWKRSYVLTFDSFDLDCHIVCSVEEPTVWRFGVPVDKGS